MHCSARSLLVLEPNPAPDKRLQIAFTAPSMAITLRIHSGERSK